MHGKIIKLKTGSLLWYMPVLVLLLFALPSSAQFYNGTQMTFGKSRIQYREFLWTYYKFDRFDTYFYLNGKELAITAAKYAQLELPLMERKLEMKLDDKIQFIIFNNMSDLKQSNIGLIGDEHYNTGGITHIVGNKVFLYFDGDQRDFERQIRSGLANVLLNQVFFGSSVGSQIKNNTLYTLPEWYRNGLFSYISEDWNTDIENKVKDGILSGRYDKFNQLTGEDALYAGHSLWKYVAEKYGKGTVIDILNMSQISRSVENGFLYVIGVSFKNLIKNWLEYFKDNYKAQEEGRIAPSGHLLKKVKKDLVYSQFKISPDGGYATYATNESGKYKLYLLNLATGKRKRVLSGGFRLEEKVDYSYPRVAWHPGSKLLAVIVEKKGEVYLYIYNIEEHSSQKIILYNFEKVVDLNYAPDGSDLVFSAVQKGQSDLYIFNIASGSFKQLTNDIYDDLNPAYLNNHEIVFASNRPDETLKWDIDVVTAPVEVPATNDIFIMNLTDKNLNLLRRITNTPFGNEIQPLPYEKGYITYLSDENGIYNRYLGHLDSTISFVDTTVHYRYYSETYPVSNYSRNILEQSISRASSSIGQIIFLNGKYLIQKEEMPAPSEIQKLSLSNTPYRESLNASALTVKKEAHIEQLKQSVGSYNKRFRNVYKTVPKSQAETRQKSNEIDINNYIFDRQAVNQETQIAYDSLGRPSVIQNNETKSAANFVVPKRLNYRVEYSINQLATQLDFTSLNYFYQPFGGGSSNGFNNLGLNGFFQVGINDLLENHRIVGGFRIPLNLNNIEYLFSYANLTDRLDKELVFVRQANENTYYYGSFTFMERIRSYQLYYILKYPFSPVLAIKGTVNARYEKYTWLSTNDAALKEPDLNQYWGGLKGEIVYDDTKQLGLNLYKGLRFKIFGEYTRILGQENKSMFVIGLDMRHYLRIHRSFIWANRLAASTSFGKNKLIYYMGGVDNWLSPKFDQSTPVDYTQNYAYQALATNMRGFNENARNGNNFAVINSELRFPVFQYFFNRPIRSDFIRNFQFVGFGDVGTAWAGKDPYSEENSFYIRYIQDGSLWIKVREQKEPLIGGFGLGARTSVLGYFLRADMAWGMEDGIIKKPKFYLSLSLDF